MVAYTWGLTNLKEGDEIILSVMEHHSNIVPWQIIAQKTGAKIRFVELTDTEEFNLQQYKTFLNEKNQISIHRPCFQYPRLHQPRRRNH